MGEKVEKFTHSIIPNNSVNRKDFVDFLFIMYLHHSAEIVE